MKYNSIFKLVLLCFAFAVMASSCVKEGPMGPAGEDGVDGVDGQDGQDGQITCLACHAGNSMEAIQAQFAMSVHSAGAIAVDYAGGRAACAQCHSHEGFVQYAEFGGVLGDITNPSAWECSTCHGIHNTFEEGYTSSLRLTDPVVANFNSSVTMDLIGNSNLCAVCHQSRTAEPNTATPGETFRISNTHYGPHHGPQANIVMGEGFAELPGSVAYPAAGNSFHHQEGASCVGCHMGEFGVGGGHSFIPSLQACIDCHDSEMDDYNYGGVQSTTASQLEQLRDKLVELGVVEYVEADDAYEPVVGTYPMVQAQAYFNWIGIEEDRSLGVHNPKYVNAILTNTLEALGE